MSKKPIIVFEGIEGTGKSHHISRIAKYLKKRGTKRSGRSFVPTAKAIKNPPKMGFIFKQ